MSLGHAALSGVATRLSRIAVNASKFSDDETWRASTGPHRGDLSQRLMFRAAAAAAPEKGHRHWACQLKRVDIASVKELRAMILAAGGTDRGLIEKSELRARARECLAAKLEPEETAEEVD